MNRRRPRPLALLVLCSACSGGDAPDGASDIPFSTRDSAGVQIVENGPIDDRVAFTLEGPIWSVGWTPQDYLWENASTGALLADRGAAVGDALSDELVLIDPAGAVTGVLGGSGQGPEDIGRLSTVVRLRGDTLLVQDRGNYRLFLVHDGERSATVDVGRAAVDHRILGLVAGTRLAMTAASYSPYSEEPWIRFPLVLLDLETGATDTVAHYDYTPSIEPGEGANPFGSPGLSGAAPDGFVTMMPTEARVEWLDAGGRLTRVLRWGEEPAPLTDSVVADFTAFYRGVLEQRGMESGAIDAQVAAILEAAEGPLPIANRIRTDDAGRLWVSSYGIGIDGVDRYRVFTTEGEWLGWVHLPPDFEILDIAFDHVLGVRRNEFDVEAVTMYRLEEGG